jgi:cytochrome P450
MTDDDQGRNAADRDASLLASASMATQRDRTTMWNTLLEAGPVVHMSGIYLFTSPEAVQYAHRNPKLFSSANMVQFGLPIDPVPVGIDPPRHHRYRHLLDPMLSPRVINAIEDDLRIQVRDLIDGFASRGSCDAMEELATPYPTSVFLALFGFPAEDRDQLITWVRTMLEHPPSVSGQPDGAREVASQELYDYIVRQIEEKRAHPGDDVLSRVLAIEGDDAFTLEELAGMCVIFTVAGLDTVTGAIGFMLQHLAEDPDLRRRVREDPELVNPMIEEVLRLEPSAPMFPRTTTEDVEVCGVHVPAGSFVMLVLASVNRADDRYENPDEIDLDQSDRGHVSFGGGVHRCLGSHLARREMKLVAQEFLARIPEFEIEEGFVPEILWPSGTLHLRSLPLRFPS